MCKLCDAGFRQNHFGSRRNFLKGAAATGIAAAGGLNLFAPRPAAADAGWSAQRHRHARPALRHSRRRRDVDGPAGRRLSPQADVLVEGKKILAVGPNLSGGGAAVIDVSGRIVMPGFIDTHHHQFETALRSFLADGVLINDGSGSPSGSTTYYEFILLKFAPGVPAAGRLHQRAVRWALAARRRRHDGARRLADPSLARSTRTLPSRR